MDRKNSFLAIALNLLASGVVPGMVALPAKAASEVPERTQLPMKEKCAALMDHMAQGKKTSGDHAAAKHDHRLHMGVTMRDCGKMSQGEGEPGKAPDAPSQGEHKH